MVVEKIDGAEEVMGQFDLTKRLKHIEEFDRRR